MKRILAGVLMVAFAATMAAAADTVTMKAKNGDVTFNHKAHSATIACKECHGEAAPGKLTLGKDAAHKLCKGCHDAKKQGPVKCGECHKK
ncbi:cytochrome c3 family protein [Geomobilimonas luticola]|uniref:Cytochrome c family protein n=1 Tax=Geomobilimonas luticola TaxID=1114878 RepID=A0ABS5SAG3_9BACT|nr:cytochrome c3 family protein [Geomobilimonas luticola]MBT0651602.1 cytochrome c family protein [Geomobilimonas luticola]